MKNRGAHAHTPEKTKGVGCPTPFAFERANDSIVDC
jgi:hypothetical protein